MKKICLAALASLLAPVAFAQSNSTVTTHYGSPVTMTAGGCTVTNVTSLTFDPAANTITTDGSGSCGNNPPPSVASVTLAISTSTYTIGSGAAAPVITWTNNTAAAVVSCTLSAPVASGITLTPVNNGNNGTFTMSNVATAGTWSFTPNCTTQTAGYTVSVTPAAVQLTVTDNTPPPPGCSSTQTSVVLGSRALNRQCTGVVDIPGGSSYTGPLTGLSQVYPGGTWGSTYNGYSPTFTITSGYYVALQFTPTTSGSLKLTQNPSYGDGGILSVSTVLGSMRYGDPGIVCSLNRGGANSALISTIPGAGNCPVTVGKTYYLQFTDTDTSGSALCWNGKPNTCGTSQISYTVQATAN